MKRKNKHASGFTLIEILIVIGLIAILAAVVLVAINPERQFAQARNTQRVSNVNSLANAITQNSADNKGVFNCPAGPVPQTPTEISSAQSGYNLYNCIVPTYIAELPIDPSAGTFTSSSDYDSGYQISEDSVTQRITISSPHAELAEVISSIR